MAKVLVLRNGKYIYEEADTTPIKIEFNRDGEISRRLVANGYDINRQIAILFNGEDTPAHAIEYANYIKLRNDIKAEVDKLV